MTPRQQGDLGELSAIEWLMNAGAAIAVPLFHSPDRDLLAERDGWILRVQVKTSNCIVKGCYAVAICTRGGNQSWNGLVKRFSTARCDYLFVLVGGRAPLVRPGSRCGGSQRDPARRFEIRRV